MYIADISTCHRSHDCYNKSRYCVSIVAYCHKSVLAYGKDQLTGVLPQVCFVFISHQNSIQTLIKSYFNIILCVQPAKISINKFFVLSAYVYYKW